MAALEEINDQPTNQHNLLAASSLQHENTEKRSLQLR